MTRPDLLARPYGARWHDTAFPTRYFNPNAAPTPLANPVPRRPVPCPAQAAQKLSSSLRCLLVLIGLLSLPAVPRLGAQSNTVSIIEAEGKVDVAHPQESLWQSAKPEHQVSPGDRVRTGERSRAVIRFTPLSTLRLGELSLIEIPGAQEKESGFSFRRGLLYFFHRDQPTTLPIRTPAGAAVIRGTEFVLKVEDNGETVLSVLDGQVDLFNEQGQVQLKTGEEGIVSPGQAPRKSPVLASTRGIQWATYYPGFLDPSELEFNAAQTATLQASLAAYGRGNLHAALDLYPHANAPTDPSAGIYRAALLLSVGNVTGAEAQLQTLDATTNTSPRQVALVRALRRTVATVLNLSWEETSSATTRTEWMAESYAHQARGRLIEARTAARAATTSGSFGFAWVRLAELEFSFGETRKATAALDEALRFMPENAQAFVLRGFLLAARNDIPAAERAFDQALELDGGLGNAWLGRGLCRIRQGRTESGRDDLQVACTVEPQRSVLRSYLGKGFSELGDRLHATRELLLARQLDSQDPTPWFYQALLLQQGNRINEAIQSLERSKALNDHRQIYRSRMLLDQDQAVRGANLAAIYRDNGMTQPGLHEATAAVENDIANYSAHLFLAESYNALRDPNQINLRYESPWLSEYLVANLLAPPGAGTLSPYVTQQDYGRLFERDRLGISSSTEYRSNGEWFQTAAQHGTFKNSAYAAEVTYRNSGGYRVNDDLDQLTTSVKLKQQLTPADGLYLQAIYYDAEYGDLAPYYDPTQVNRGLRVKERQEPMLFAGYHHEWAPGSHSLFLAGRLSDRMAVRNPEQLTLVLDRSVGPLPEVSTVSVNQHYRSELEIYTAEAQQLWQNDQHAFILGGRYQRGDFTTESRQQSLLFGLVSLDLSQQFAPEMERASGYTYYHYRPIDELLLLGGVSVDHLTYPDQFRYAPLAGTEAKRERVSPKAGIVWSPAPETTLRAAYARALSGVSLDQSLQLEPAQVAGLTQTLRSLIPESIAGANAAAPLEMAGVTLDQRFGQGTYVGMSGQRLNSTVDRRFGVFEWLPGLVASSVRETLDYEEWAALAWINQRLDRDWSLGLSYRLSRAELQTGFPGIPDTAPGSPPDQALKTTTHRVNAFVRLNHPSGFFAELDASFTQQSNRGFSPVQPGDELGQLDMAAGYRFARRRAEVRVGLLNVTDRDYRLSALGWTERVAHERTLVTSLRLAF